MVTMVDEIFDRHYREGRAELNSSIDRALKRLSNAITNVFNVLQRIEYDAPWAPSRRRARKY
jgi:hypothetical protein